MFLRGPFLCCALLIGTPLSPQGYRKGSPMFLAGQGDEAVELGINCGRTWLTGPAPADLLTERHPKRSQSLHRANCLITKRKYDNTVYQSWRVLDAPHARERIRPLQRLTLKGSPSFLQLEKKKNQDLSLQRQGHGLVQGRLLPQCTGSPNT